MLNIYPLQQHSRKWSLFRTARPTGTWIQIKLWVTAVFSAHVDAVLIWPSLAFPSVYNLAQYTRKHNTFIYLYIYDSYIYISLKLALWRTHSWAHSHSTRNSWVVLLQLREKNDLLARWIRFSLCGLVVSVLRIYIQICRKVCYVI